MNAQVTPTWVIQYEIPPLRAVYRCECTCDTEQKAREVFNAGIPHGKILTIKPKNAPDSH